MFSLAESVYSILIKMQHNSPVYWYTTAEHYMCLCMHQLIHYVMNDVFCQGVLTWDQNTVSHKVKVGLPVSKQ